MKAFRMIVAVLIAVAIAAPLAQANIGPFHLTGAYTDDQNYIFGYGQDEPLVKDVNGISDISFSLDGKVCAYTSVKTTSEDVASVAYVRDLKTGKVGILAISSTVSVTNPRVNGRRGLYLKDGVLYLADISNIQAPVTLHAIAGGENFRLSSANWWGMDRVVFSRWGQEGDEIYSKPVSARPQDPQDLIIVNSGASLANPIVSIDGTLYFNRWQEGAGQHGIWTANPYEQSEGEPLIYVDGTTEYFLFGWQPTPDPLTGATLYYVVGGWSDSRYIARLSLLSRRKQKLVQFGPFGHTDIALYYTR